jgi:DNA-binding response OmpR family regulator
MTTLLPDTCLNQVSENADEDHSPRGEVCRTSRQALDAIVLDLMLPGEDGLSLTRWLRAQSSVPILMLSARV